MMYIMFGLLIGWVIRLYVRIDMIERKNNLTDYGCREDFSSRGKEDEY